MNGKNFYIPSRIMRYLHIPAIITFITTFYSCDYVKSPYPPKIPCDNDTVACPLPTFTINPSPVKKILLEDYTGHKCGNCPKAGREAVKLDTTYGEQLVVVSVHAGGFAHTYPGLYSYDFQTTAGDEYDEKFGVSTAGNPNGMINRIGYPANNHIKGWTSWASGIQAIINNSPDADIQIINSYNSADRKLCVHVQSKFLKQMAGTYKLVVLLTEDSIIKPQIDYTKPPPPFNDTNYVHRHAMRAAISCGGAWGDKLANGTITAGNTYIKSYVYNMPTDFNGLAPDVTHCAVIAYIYDDDLNSPSYKQVIQAEEKKIY